MPPLSARFLSLLGVAAFLIRLAAVLLLRDIQVGPVGSATADDVDFNNRALHIAAGEGYINDQGHATSFRAPGWPIFLAGIYAVAGDVPPVVYVVLCLLGALSCVLTYLLARELLTEPWARVAGVMAGFYLGHIHFATVFLSEGLFTPLLTLGTLFFVRRLKGGGLVYLVSAGLILGYATLVRPFTVLMLPLLVLLLMGWRPKRWAAGLVPALAFALPFLAVLLPWTYRNYLVHDRFVLVATNGGSTFYGSNNERVAKEPRNFGYWISTTELPHRALIESQPDEVSHDKMEWKLGMDWLRDHPAMIPWLGILKFARMWWLPEFDPGPVNYLLRIVFHLPFVLLWLIALVRLTMGAMATVFRGHENHAQNDASSLNPHAHPHAVGMAPDYFPPAWMVLHLTMLATVLTVLIFWGCARFRDANLSILAIYASVGLQIVMTWFRKRA